VTHASCHGSRQKRQDAKVSRYGSLALGAASSVSLRRR